MEEYLNKKDVINILDEYLKDSRGAEHFAYNAIKMEILAMPSIVIKEDPNGRT